MTVPPIRIVPASEGDAKLWRLTREVSDILRRLPWTLIGGQMVAIIEAEHGGSVGRATFDVDTLLDVRLLPAATHEAALRLLKAGFEPMPGEGGLTYRFIRGSDVVDVLAPDNLGKQVNLSTVPPSSTLEALGGTQAIKRSRMLVIEAGDGPFELSVPSLAGAILIKARVASATALTTREKHERDLARLLALVVDPGALRSQLTVKERGYLRAHSGMLRLDHPAWRGITGAEDAALALEIMAA